MISLIKQNVFAVILSVLAIVTVLSLGGCGAEGSVTTANIVTASTAATISLTSTGTSVKSDGTNSVTITATVLTAGNSVLSGQALTFSASSGQLSAASATTDATGMTTFTFSAGPSGLNRTATITVTATGSTTTASIPIQVTGSTLKLTAGTTNSPAGTAVPITIVAKDASGNAVASQPLNFSVAATSTGSGTLSATTGTSNTNGTATVNLTGTAAGNVDVLVQWLDASGAITASATISITVSGAGSSFSVTTPASSPFPVTISTPQPVVVSVPPTIGSPGVAVAKIRYATTMGTWANGGAAVITVTPAGTTDTQSFLPGSSAGNATIQIDALDANGAILATATLTLSVTAGASAALSPQAIITLQSNVTVLAPSTGTTQSTATLTAKVSDGANPPQPVGGASVLFQLINSTGTGETISPVVTTTNTGAVAGFPAGTAQAIYTAGTSTTQNSAVRASIVGNPAASAVLNITVGGTAGSIAIGPSSKILVDPTNTYYQLPVTVFVTDSTGASVSGAVVSLSLWPEYYFKGYRNALCVAQYASAVLFPNEDKNKNLVLDAGEDIDGPGGDSGSGVLCPSGPVPSGSSLCGTPDGVLWPPLAAAGSLPTSVTTDANGRATFNWSYLKQYADWVTARLTATTLVQGSQSTASTLINLVPAATDVVSPCSLPNSPFN